MTPQFLLSPADIANERFLLRGPEAFHVTRVLRRRPGETIELFDGKGGRYTGVIETLHPDGSLEGRIQGGGPAQGEARLAVVNLYLGLLKASHWEWALEKATELGAASITPVITPRTVVRLREDATEAKRQRWGKILLSAAKQCGRAAIPQLGAPAHFRDAIIDACKKDGSLTLVAWEKKAAASTYAGLREALGKARAEGGRRPVVNVFIGPEGGFSDEEMELAECEGAELFGLGPNVLRAETAALAALSIVLYELGGL